MAENPSGIAEKISIIRKHVDKLLIVLATIAMAVSAVLTYDYKQTVDCHVGHLEADRKFTTEFSSAMVILLAQPPAPADQRRLAFERVRDSLAEKHRVQQQLGDCQ